VGLPLPRFTPHHSPRSFQRKLFKGKPFIFYFLPFLCFFAATTSSSSLRPCSLHTPQLRVFRHCMPIKCIAYRNQMAKHSAKKQAIG
jgi:hypothetical protein